MNEIYKTWSLEQELAQFHGIIIPVGDKLLVKFRKIITLTANSAQLPRFTDSRDAFGEIKLISSYQSKFMSPTSYSRNVVVNWRS